jgi:hypothetical protein
MTKSIFISAVKDRDDVVAAAITIKLNTVSDNVAELQEDVDKLFEKFNFQGLEDKNTKKETKKTSFRIKRTRNVDFFMEVKADDELDAIEEAIEKGEDNPDKWVPSIFDSEYEYTAQKL